MKSTLTSEQGPPIKKSALQCPSPLKIYCYQALTGLSTAIDVVKDPLDLFGMHLFKGYDTR